MANNYVVKWTASEVKLVLGAGPLAYTLSPEGVLTVYAREGLTAAPDDALQSQIEEGFTTWIIRSK